MRCTRFRGARLLLALAGAGLLAACKGPAAPPGGAAQNGPAAPAASALPSAPASPPVPAAPASPAPPASQAPLSSGAGPGSPAPAGTPAPATPSSPGVPTGAAGTPALAGPAPRNWEEYKARAARRIASASANAGETFSGPLPEPLQSIPVLQVQLNQDGSVRNIAVLRRPKFVPETIEMAKTAIRRAAPFGPVGALPPPWQFTETFLYNGELKFQLRSLVE